jgi:AcrR family transcriptional regulator
MTRTVGSSGIRTEAAIREAATQLIAERGYEAVSMRELAQAVGVQAAALYRYFPNKEELLFTLMNDHMSALLATWEEARHDNDTASARLAAFVRNHVRFHVDRRHATHVSNMELRSLSRENLSAILRLRGTYEKELRQILRDGQLSGEFEIDDINLTAMAIIQMMTGVIVWFRPDDRLSVDQVGENYLEMVRRLLGAKRETILPAGKTGET